MAETVRSCDRCELHATRMNTVFGAGNAAADWMFVGEAPGAEEDRQGLPFVGRAGQLLNAMLSAIGMGREEVYIANVLKCRPPDNRTPLPEEMATCQPYLEEQIALLQPRVIITLGAVAAKALLDVTTGITRLRGKWMSFRGIDLMPTFHPAYLLRNPSAKREAWEDLKAVLHRLGKEPPSRSGNRAS